MTPGCFVEEFSQRLKPASLLNCNTLLVDDGSALVCPLQG